jgi:hypothetical protein
MKAYANTLAAVEALVSGRRQPRFGRWTVLQLERMVRQVAALLRPAGADCADLATARH